MTDAPLPGKKVFRSGDTVFEIVETAPLEPRYVDYYTELRIDGGVLHISLGAAVADYGEGGSPQIRVVTRLRLPLTTLANIQAGVEQIQSQLAQAKQTAN